MAKEEIKKVEEPKVEETKNEVKKETKTKSKRIKNKKFEPKDNIVKVNLDNPGTQKEEKDELDVPKVNVEESPVKNEEVEKEPVKEEVIVVNPDPQVEKEVVQDEKVEEQPIVQEITNEEEVVRVKEEVEDAIVESQQTGKPLPEKVEKLISFMEETGGDLNDYVNLNRDISKMDDSDVLDEYYRATKSHLTPEERHFLLEERYGVDEEVDDPKEIKKKRIALKEQVAEARAHLDRQKSKYYEEIKAGSKLTDEQKQAISFFEAYNKQSEEQKKLSDSVKSTFMKRTNNFFNEDFKGFDYQVGDKKFRFNVKDVGEVKNNQADLNNFVNRYIGKGEKTISDTEGYHKSLFTAMNADAVAKHFYEQGRADAIKDSVTKDKNINLDPRQTHGEISAGGVKVRVLGQSSSDMKNRSFKIRKKN